MFSGMSPRRSGPTIAKWVATALCLLLNESRLRYGCCYIKCRYITEEEWPYHWFPTFPIGTGHALNYAAVRNTPFFGAVFSTSYAKSTLVCQDRLGTNTRKR